MTNIYLIRHAEAEGNLYRRLHGQYNSLTTVRGALQIRLLNIRFEDIQIDKVYSSDLYRTVRTAAAISGIRNLQTITDPRLRELNVGEWEDTTFGELEYREPEKLILFNNDPAHWEVPGGETFDSVQSRMLAALTDIAAENDGKTVAVFSHGCAIRALLCKLKGIASENIAQLPHGDNTSVALLHYDDGKFEVEYYGDSSHLNENTSTFAHQQWWKENLNFDNTNLRYEELPVKPYTYMACLKEKEVGIVDLDIKTGQEKKVGIVAHLEVLPRFRKTGVAVQLLGQATSVFRKLGRDTMQTYIPPGNKDARVFFSTHGFSQTLKLGDLIVMEKNIKVG